MVRHEDGLNYYAYVLTYVYDSIVIHHDAKSVLMIINRYFKFTPNLIGDRDIYLWAKLKNET